MNHDVTVALPILDPVTLQPVEAPAPAAPALPERLVEHYLETFDFGGYAVAAYDHGHDTVWLEIAVDGAWQACGTVREASTANARIRVRTIVRRDGRTVIEQGSGVEAALLTRARTIGGRR